MRGDGNVPLFTHDTGRRNHLGKEIGRLLGRWVWCGARTARNLVILLAIRAMEPFEASVLHAHQLLVHIPTFRAERSVAVSILAPVRPVIVFDGSLQLEGFLEASNLFAKFLTLLREFERRLLCIEERLHDVDVVEFLGQPYRVFDDVNDTDNGYFPFWSINTAACRCLAGAESYFASRSRSAAADDEPGRYRYETCRRQDSPSPRSSSNRHGEFSFLKRPLDKLVKFPWFMP